MKKFKYFSFVLLFMALCIPMVSCSDDDDDDLKTQDYTIEATVSGGGLTNEQLNYLQEMLDDELEDLIMEDVTEDQAEYLFDIFISTLKSEFSNGVDYLSGTLYMNFYLKNQKGKTVESATLKITNRGCTVS